MRSRYALFVLIGRSEKVIRVSGSFEGLVGSARFGIPLTGGIHIFSLRGFPPTTPLLV
jgi:hypothetical protein